MLLEVPPCRMHAEACALCDLSRSAIAVEPVSCLPCLGRCCFKVLSCKLPAAVVCQSHRVSDADQHHCPSKAAWHKADKLPDLAADLLSLFVYVTPAGMRDEGGVAQPAHLSYDSILLRPPVHEMKVRAKVQPAV
jgi:hypothetical protein